MKIVSKIFIASLLTCIFYACTYNKTELPKPGDETETVTTNPTGAVVTYTSHVQDIMVANCASCHGGQSGLFLNSYSPVKGIADDGRLLLWAIQGGGSQPMPTGGLMPQTTLDTLQMWLDQGALE
jgi:mono/diheme cytochrome c family protein